MAVGLSVEFLVHISAHYSRSSVHTQSSQQQYPGMVLEDRDNYSPTVQSPSNRGAGRQTSGGSAGRGGSGRGKAIGRDSPSLFNGGSGNPLSASLLKGEVPVLPAAAGTHSSNSGNASKTQNGGGSGGDGGNTLPPPASSSLRQARRPSALLIFPSAGGGGNNALSIASASRGGSRPSRGSQSHSHNAYGEEVSAEGGGYDDGDDDIGEGGGGGGGLLTRLSAALRRFCCRCCARAWWSPAAREDRKARAVSALTVMGSSVFTGEWVGVACLVCATSDRNEDRRYFWVNFVLCNK